MIEKLKEVLGLLSGYKTKYDEAIETIEKANDIIDAQKKMLVEGEYLADQILDSIKNWNAHK